MNALWRLIFCRNGTHAYTHWRYDGYRFLGSCRWCNVQPPRMPRDEDRARPYSEECRKAIAELEERFAHEEVELVSMEHHEAALRLRAVPEVNRGRHSDG